MPYIGMFTEEAIQRAIDRAAEKLPDGASGLVLHADSDGEASLSLVKRFGDRVSVEVTGAAIGLGSGFKFDREHLKLEAELIARF